MEPQERVEYLEEQVLFGIDALGHEAARLYLAIGEGSDEEAEQHWLALAAAWLRRAKAGRS